MKKVRINPAAYAAAVAGDLENFFAASTPGGIGRQEAAGQAAFVSSDTLPIEVHGATRKQLEALGFVFGEDVDMLFVQCKLPPGWTKRATEHSMNSEILDASGCVRATVFYKAAFYDRRADVRMRRRYDIDSYGTDENGKYRTVVKDNATGAALHSSELSDSVPNFHTAVIQEEEAREFLDKSYPDWRDPLAYWE